jgi:hypothetical protein
MVSFILDPKFIPQNILERLWTVNRFTLHDEYTSCLCAHFGDKGTELPATPL